MLQLSAFIHFRWTVNLLCGYLCKCRVLRCAFSKRFVFRLKDATTERIKTALFTGLLMAALWLRLRGDVGSHHKCFSGTHTHTNYVMGCVCIFGLHVYSTVLLTALSLHHSVVREHCHWSHFVIRHLGGSLQPCTHSYTCIDIAQTPILCCLSASSGIFFCLFPLDCSSFSCFLMPDCFPFIRDSQS